VTIKIVKYGSGLTETEAYQFGSEPMTAEERAVFDELNDQHTVTGRLKFIERQCIEILEEAGLPTGPSWYERGFANVPWPVARERGFAPDSREGFATKMLADVWSVRECLKRGEHEEVAMTMFFLGYKWAASGIKKRHGSKSRPLQSWRNRDRDIAMAREFLRRRPQETFLSDSALKAHIGAKLKPKPLRRNSAIEAVDRGLQFLSG